MAIKGFITPNTYTSIVNTIYEKQMNRCTVLLDIYKDSKKDYLYGNKSFTVDGSILIPSIISLTPIKTIPEGVKDQFFLIANDAEGELAGMEGRIGRIGPSGRVDSYYLENERFFFFVEDEQKYRSYINGQWVEKQVLSDKRIWDKWFAPEVALAAGTNPTQQMYKFLKTLSEFKDCEDV